MATDIKGTAVVFGTGGITMTFGVTAVTNMPQSIRHGVTAENTKIKTTGGNVATIVYHGMMRTASITVVPSSTTLALALTTKEVQIALPGLKVAIADSTSAQLDGNWIIVSAVENRPVDGFVTIDLELENSYDTDLSTSAS